MKAVTIAGLFGVALLAVLVRPSYTQNDSLDVTIFADIDLTPLRKVLNELLVEVLEVPLLSKEQYGDKIIELEVTTGKLLCFVNGLDQEIQDRMYDVLEDLLRTVADILEDLLQGLNINVRGFFFLVLDLMKSLGLNIDYSVLMQLTKLVKTDMQAYFHT